MSDIVLKALHLITQYFFTKTLRMISILQMENREDYRASEVIHVPKETLAKYI